MAVTTKHKIIIWLTLKLLLQYILTHSQAAVMEVMLAKWQTLTIRSIWAYKSLT